MKKLLLISYYWPPLGGPGSLRPVKFAKYLPGFDIEPIVLTRKHIAYHSMDCGLANELRQTRVIRTESFDPARILYLLGMRLYRPKTWQVPIKKALNFPDSKLGWIPFAYCAGTRIDFDYIFVTAPSFSSFIAGYALAKRTFKPLILDFRDAWFEFPFMRYESGVQKKLVSYWEKKITDFASLIIVVDENIRDSLIKKYPSLSGKIHVIPNGYDPDDFAATPKPDLFTITYLGTIRKERNPQNFLKALDKLTDEQKIQPNELNVKFIGHIEEQYLKEIKKYPFTQITGHLPYKAAIEQFLTSHLALMVTTGDEYFFPSRQNEYLASRLPIIVCGKSKGVHLIESAFKHGYPGWVFGYDDIDGMKQKVLEIFNKYKRGEIIKGETPYQEYTRENLTRKLAELVKKI